METLAEMKGEQGKGRVWMIWDKQAEKWHLDWKRREHIFTIMGD